MSDEFISENLPGLGDKAVLDAGCGTGKFCMFAIQRGAGFVKGIDLSPAMIDEAKKNCPEAEFEYGDLTEVRIEPERYDVVICGLVMGHIENHEAVVIKLTNALKKGGVIIITDFHPAQTMMKAKRTFKDSHSGKTFEIRHTGHAITDYLSIFKKAGVDQLVLKEPAYNDKPVIFGICGVKS